MKRTKRKRFLALGLAVVMLLSLGQPAFAGVLEESTGEGWVEILGDEGQDPAEKSQAGVSQEFESETLTDDDSELESNQELPGDTHSEPEMDLTGDTLLPMVMADELSAFATAVTTEQELIDAIATATDGEVITLGQSITLSGPLLVADDLKITLRADTEVELIAAAGERHLYAEGNGHLGPTITVAITFENVILNGKGIGGGIEGLRAHLALKNATIVDCQAGSGGAICVMLGDLSITGDSLLAGNRASFGGAIYLNNSVGSLPLHDAIVMLNGVQIRDNEVTSTGGAVYANVSSGEMDITITNCVIDDNRSELNGGGLAIEGTGTNSQTGANAQASVTIHKTSLCGNAALKAGGGALRIVNNGTAQGTFDVSLEDCDISRNSAGTIGGAIDFQTYNKEGQGKDSTLHIEKCTINGNTGASIVQIAPDAYDALQVDIQNCEFTGNAATGDGGAITYLGHQSTTPASHLVSISGSLFQDNTAAGDGGAISGRFTSGKEITSWAITDSRFENNSAHTNGGAISFTGNGVSQINILGGVTFANNQTNAGNTAQNAYNMGGGAVYAKDIGLRIKAEAGEEIHFEGNQTALCGGAVQVPGNRVFTVLADGGVITFAGNESQLGETMGTMQTTLSYGGGAIALNHGALSTLEESRVAAVNGGRILFDSNSSRAWGGAIQFNPWTTISGGSPPDFRITADAKSEIEFVGNAARRDGGAISRNTVTVGALHIAAEYVSEEQRGKITFHDNHATNGGAINLAYATTASQSTKLTLYRLLNLSRVDFFDNTAQTTAPWTLDNAQFADYAQIYQEKIQATTIDTDRHTNAYNNDDINFVAYTVTFHRNDGSGEIHTQQHVAPANSAWEPEEPTSSTHEFVGWYADAEGETEFDFAAKINQDTEVYAKWVEKEIPPEIYTVTYHANYEDADPAEYDGGAFEAGQEVTVGQGNLFVREGYTFLGWSWTEDGELAYEADEVAGEAGRPIFPMPEFNVNLYAKWEKDPVDPPDPEPTYTVTYHANYKDANPAKHDGGAFEAGQEVTVAQGNLFVREGYTFRGWMTEDGKLAYDADELAGEAGRPIFPMPEFNVNLYAKWEKDPVDPPDPEPTYTVTYHANYQDANPAKHDGGAFEAGQEVTVAQGNLFVREGYTFRGWSWTEDGELAYEADEVAGDADRPTFPMPETDVDLYAQWEKIVEPPAPKDPPVLIYWPNGGSREDGSTDPYRDESPVKDEYYTIRNNEESLELGYIKEGYRFLGWHETPDPAPDTTTGWYQEGTRITVDWEGDKEVYAIWVAAQGDYLVRYNANCSPFEGSVIDGNNAYFESDEVIVQANQYFYPPDYYQFVGWNLMADGSGEWYDPDDIFAMPAHDVILYAQWELKPFAVYYHANATSYTGRVEDSNTYVRGDVVTVLANGFSRSGYTFTGWSETADGAVVYTAAQLAAGGSEEMPTFAMPGRDVHLYAQWSKDSTGGGGGGGGTSSYNVIYHSIYATKTATDGTYKSGATVSVKEHAVFPPDTIEVPAGVTFLGWSDSLNGATVIYLPADTFLMPSRDVHLYAVYEVEEDLLNRDDHYAYVVGYPDGTVRPNDLITREEVTTIFFRLLTDAARDQHWWQSNDFSDVQHGRWSNNAISTMQNAGIITGYEDGSFRPAGHITRAEVAVIAAQFDRTVYNGASKFGDISGHWAVDYINRAAERGWVSGYPDGDFRPDAYITRAEMMTLINNVLDRNPQSPADLLDDMVRWPDNTNSNAWYYLPVQEATNSHYYERYENEIDHLAGSEYWTQLRPVRDWAALEQRM